MRPGDGPQISQSDYPQISPSDYAQISQITQIIVRFFLANTGSDKDQQMTFLCV
jgi:hypothetical protein